MTFAEGGCIWRLAMSHIRAGLRPAFALFIMAHAVAHALLPWQEFLTPASRAIDEGPVILLSVVGAGFTIAALGVLGVRPFTALGRAAMVLASAYSLIAISRMGQGDLWWGVPVDLALFLIGVTGVWPRPAAQSATTPLHSAAATPASHRTA
jgi:formate-dependent nitrite reductase membrane component NrfD